MLLALTISYLAEEAMVGTTTLIFGPDSEPGIIVNYSTIILISFPLSW